jgi:tripartite-type tricarboxylate transporter receptor subunit TctC
MRTTRRHATALLLATPLLSRSRATQAQERYPARPIRLVIPFVPGGSSDILGRKLAARLGPVLGQTVVVENRGGAGGMLATVEVARTRPDGYTLLLATSSTHAINPTAMAEPAYDPVRDFASIAVTGLVPMVVAVNNAVPARSLPELVALARAQPGRLAYGSAGMGSINHLTGELFKQEGGGLDILHVPYRGSGQSVIDLIGGRIQILMATFPTVVAHARDGQLRLLAICNEQRSALAPEIPTAVEQGLPDMVAYSFNLLVAPAGTPQPIVNRLFEAVRQVESDPSFQRELQEVVIEPVVETSPANAARFVERELARFAPIIRATGTRVSF